MPNVSSGASKTAVTYPVKWFGFDGVGGGFETQISMTVTGPTPPAGGLGQEQEAQSKATACRLTLERSPFAFGISHWRCVRSRSDWRATGWSSWC